MVWVSSDYYFFGSSDITFLQVIGNICLITKKNDNLSAVESLLRESILACDLKFP